VQHILGTCTAAGAVVVWDLKKQKPVISFKDPSGRKRCSALQWNPEVATQLVVASDDDMAPSLQLWDLRNSVSPVREFHGHAKGVLGLSWCPQDPSFLLSSGKDNRTICWDVNAGGSAWGGWGCSVRWGAVDVSTFGCVAGMEGRRRRNRLCVFERAAARRR
jgi:protein transport protein SEC31